jgi:hypothetical protein
MVPITNTRDPTCMLPITNTRNLVGKTISESILPSEAGGLGKVDRV